MQVGGWSAAWALGRSGAWALGRGGHACVLAGIPWQRLATRLLRPAAPRSRCTHAVPRLLRPAALPRPAGLCRAGAALPAGHRRVREERWAGLAALLTERAHTSHLGLCLFGRGGGAVGAVAATPTRARWQAASLAPALPNQAPPGVAHALPPDCARCRRRRGVAAGDGDKVSGRHAGGRRGAGGPGAAAGAGAACRLQHRSAQSPQTHGAPAAPYTPPHPHPRATPYTACAGRVRAGGGGPPLQMRLLPSSPSHNAVRPQVLAEYTQAVVDEAGAMLDEALAAASAALGQNAVPDQDEVGGWVGGCAGLALQLSTSLTPDPASGHCEACAPWVGALRRCGGPPGRASGAAALRSRSRAAPVWPSASPHVTSLPPARPTATSTCPPAAERNDPEGHCHVRAARAAQRDAGARAAGGGRQRRWVAGGVAAAILRERASRGAAGDTARVATTMRPPLQGI